MLTQTKVVITLSKNNLNSAVLIPAYQPDEKLSLYVDDLIEIGFKKIIIVNDGSKDECNVIFDSLKERPECIVIGHSPNRGKGYALKSGLQYFMDNCHEFSGIITADADGQHKAVDAAAIAEKINSNPDSLVVGVRDFSSPSIPARSRFGNKTTSIVFKVTHGVYLSDTQTGLRGIPRSLVPQMITISGNRYEYEMNVLIDCADKDINFIEVPIETIYIDDNASSHFRPVRDSVRIYSLILKKPLLYILSSLSSFLVDIAVFALLNALLPSRLSSVSILGVVMLNILIATVGARVISSLYNFFVNQRIVFKQNKNTGTSLVKYYCLCAVQTLASAILVTMAIKLLNTDGGFIETLYKCIVDTVLFIISYQIQRKWVFKSQK